MSIPSDSISGLVTQVRHEMPVFSENKDDEDIQTFALRFLISNGDDLEEESVDLLGVDVCPDGRATIDPDICGSCEFYQNDCGLPEADKEERVE